MMPFALGEAAIERAERDGCGCPPWVERCAHFNERYLAFHKCPAPAQGWAVCTGQEPAQYLQYAEGHASNVADIYLDKTKALEVFYAAEEALLRGGVE